MRKGDQRNGCKSKKTLSSTVNQQCSSRLLPMLKSCRREARSVAAFHFTLEATIKKEQNKLDVFQVR